MKNKSKKREAWISIKSIFLVIAGTLVLSFGTAVFILPFDLVTGGVSGLSIVIHRILPADLVSVDTIITVVTWTLFLLGLLVLGKSFALKTLSHIPRKIIG